VGASVPDIDETAEMILTSKAFDNGTACVAEQSVVVAEPVAGDFLTRFEHRGGYLMSAVQQAALAGLLFDDRGTLRPGPVGQSAVRLAELAGFSVPARTRVLAAILDRVRSEIPLSREILGPVLSVYRVPDSAAGWQRCREVLGLGGLGHTVAVHTQDHDEVALFGTLPAGRILVNTPAVFGGMGYSAEVDPSFQLGTGTWSGSICSDNVTPLHLINIKRIAHEIRPWRTVYDPVELP
jgi:acetaldehyde dehydrogenase (acetylating)